MKFVAFERAMQGTGASRRLRISGRTPGIVYGGTGVPQLIELDHNALWHALKKETFHSTILDMEVAGKDSKVLLRDVQMHPYKPFVQHIDFQRVEANTMLHMKVPFHYTGEENSQAIKFDGCIANHVLTEIDIKCLPANLPEFIAIDLSGLKKGVSLHLDDIKLPDGVTAVTHGKKNPVLVSVVMIGGAEPAAADAAAAAAGAAGAAAPAAAGAKAAAPAAKGAAPAAKAAAPAGKTPAAKAPAAKK
jgi:large subunit ribosomal protein L25